jgi:hydrogenase maturation protein HypF
MQAAKRTERVRATIRGAVQGVGFRPFVYRLARQLELGGWVVNSPHGVVVEAEGPSDALRDFVLRLTQEKPPRASIHSLEFSFLDPVGLAAFAIRESEAGGAPTALVLPDIATCPDCLAEVQDPADRRHRYPFTNCVNCGPRFSIVQALPYDRPNTTMAGFAMCADCRAEYDDPSDRRFHAQPTACPACGPHLEWWDPAGRVLADRGEALHAAAAAIRQGRIVAVKGLGGFHLMADARNDEAVRRLRARKHREEKPFALMYPSLGLLRAHCRVSALEERLLTSPEAPIVLLRRDQAGIAPSVAPENPYLGAMLPYTPLHHLLLGDLEFPVVATSGNLSDEPICTDEREALTRLGSIAEMFLVHNRPIARHVDDSIARLLLDRELVLRRARGYAPLPVLLREPAPPALAVGAHLKNTVAVTVGRAAFLSQHIGDLETLEATQAFEQVIESFERLYRTRPDIVACDAHPDYASTHYAIARNGAPLRVQHHQAHVLACMAENDLTAPLLGVSWDGTGYGLDGTVWGGEFFQLTEAGFERFAHLYPFRLPGGEQAVREPRRAALGLLVECLGEACFGREDLPPVAAFPAAERALLQRMLLRGINSPLTSSAGRLFDGIAALLGLRLTTAFEGQAAMALEWSADDARTDAAYPCPVAAAGPPHLVDWRPMLQAILTDLAGGAPTAVIAGKFHNSLAETIVGVAQLAGETKVVLTGGCFQNRILTERTVHRLAAAGFAPYWHQRVPPNDGGIALGQILAVVRATGPCMDRT